MVTSDLPMTPILFKVWESLHLAPKIELGLSGCPRTSSSPLYHIPLVPPDPLRRVGPFYSSNIFLWLSFKPDFICAKICYERKSPREWTSPGNGRSREGTTPCWSTDLGMHRIKKGEGEINWWGQTGCKWTFMIFWFSLQLATSTVSGRIPHISADQAGSETSFLYSREHSRDAHFRSLSSRRRVQWSVMENFLEV